METGEVSFTKQVKSELSARSYTTEEKKSLLSGFIRNGAVFSIGSKPSLELRTEIASVCKLIYSSLKDVYQRTPRITYEKKTRFKKGVIYRISVRDKRLYDRREELEVFKDGIERIPPKNRLHRKNLSSFLRPSQDSLARFRTQTIPAGTPPHAPVWSRAKILRRRWGTPKC